MSLVRRGDGFVRPLGRARGGGTLRGVCELVQRREGECVAVQMLAVSSSLQTGDPGLETRHLRLLQGDRNTNFETVEKKCTETLPYLNFGHIQALKNFTLMSRDSLEVSMDFSEAWS